jgi:pimeloyl-ACP methyl ester carboxylesterase
VSLTAYGSSDNVIDTDLLNGSNVWTGQMANLTVYGSLDNKIAYVIISGVANRWLIDDLSTDASGVPNTRDPIVFLPGIAGSKLENDHNEDGTYDEVWPNISRLILPGRDEFVLVLRLDQYGQGPLQTDNPEYTTVRVGDVMRKEPTGIPFVDKDIYGTTIEYFTEQRGYEEGKDFIVCPYDWRQHIGRIAEGDLEQTLDKCIQTALNENPHASQVNILAHSMGGLVARAYIADPDRAENVHRLITLGTPYLGAPKIAMAILGPLCFIEDDIWRLNACFSHPETVHELVQNFPSVYQIAPSDSYFQVYPDGYYYRARDLKGDGKDDGYLTPDEMFALLGGQNENLAPEAREFQLETGGWSNGSTNGVEVYMMVGDGIGSPSLIVEYEKPIWYAPWRKEVALRLEEPFNGDKTVPLRSANLRYLEAETPVDLSDDVPTFYFNLEHGELPVDLGVLRLSADIFEAASPTTATTLTGQASTSLTGIYPDNGDTESSQPTNLTGYTVPRTEPMPLNGRFIMIDGQVEVEILDDAGNRIGIIGTEVEDGWENSIPGASYATLPNTHSIFLPHNSEYQIKIYGQVEGTADVRIQQYESDMLEQTALYKGLPLTDNSTATLNYSPSASIPGSFELDQNGDGVIDDIFVVTDVLDAEESRDRVAPMTTISISGTPSPDGWYTGLITVTLMAADNPGGTGVSKIEYSLNMGQTVETYVGPFTVDAGQVHLILAKATDRAGNEETPFARAGVLRIYLPFMTR